MKKYLKNISAALLTVSLFAACTKEMVNEVDTSLRGVDRNEIVDLSLPISTSGGMESVIVTKAADLDSQLASVLVLVYEAIDPSRPELNKFISSKFYTAPTQGKAQEGWYPDPNDLTRGTLNLSSPTGDVYIYLMANWTNAFIDFAEGISADQLNDESIMPRTQRELFEKFIPKWKGNVHRIDGLVPMVATVNNTTGLCHVSPEGEVTYRKENDPATYTIAKDGRTFTKDGTFGFTRLMAKVTMKFQVMPKDPASQTEATFNPTKFIVRNAATYIPPTPNAWPVEDPLFIDLRAGVGDTKDNNFSTQSPDEFTIYLPGNLESTNAVINSQPERELMVKTEDGRNVVYPEGDPQAGKFQFKNAPKNATYIEVIGKYEDPENGIISADTRYFIHMGDFSLQSDGSRDFTDFNVRRDHHYTYNVKVKGVNEIIVESKDNTGRPEDEGNREINPGTDGLVFIGGLRAYCDAHYDQVELEINKTQYNDSVIIFTFTPYGAASGVYFPKGSTDKDGQIRQSGVFRGLSKNSDSETIQTYINWIEMIPQNRKGNLALYHPSNNHVSIFDALDDAWQKGGSHYYTCFVNENYYLTRPDGTKARLSDFVNRADRSLALGKDMFMSKDMNSVSVDAVYLIYQKSISTFYDLNDETKLKYGVESINETMTYNNAGRPRGLGYGTPRASSSDAWNGRNNTILEIGNDQSSRYQAVNWRKNGWLIEEVDGEQRLVDQGVDRLNDPLGYLACLSRNRDLNGDRALSDDEIRWYNPALNQMLGIWIGEAAMPRSAAVYNDKLENMEDLHDPAQTSYGLFTSTNDQGRVFWATEGASFGQEYQVNTAGGHIRAARNLGTGTTAAEDFAHSSADDMEKYHFYTYNENDNTLEVQLSEICLRSFSPGELEPHTERSPVNRVYKKIQLGNNLMNGTFSPVEAKTGNSTQARDYINDRNAPAAPRNSTVGEWRLPNQRELALMVIFNKNFYNKQGSFGKISGTIQNRTTFYLNRRLSVEPYNLGIYSTYTDYGYFYDAGYQKIQCSGGDGYYFCVRDVQ